MKKTIYIVVTILEVLLLAGSWAVDFFTRKRMGMARYVIWLSSRWEEHYPIERMKYIFAGVLIILILTLLILFMKRRAKIKRYFLWEMIASGLLSSGVLWFMLTSSREDRRSYYLLVLILGTLAFVQTVKTLMGISVRNNEE